MANIYWLGTAPAVSQIETFQVTAFDAATTYIMTINGVTVSVIGNTDVDTTASDLQVALEASTHPYFSSITWTVATDTVTATGPAGAPFTATASVTGGTGTIGAGTITTTFSGPNDWNTAANWSAGSVPVSTDNVVIKNSSANIAWGLDQNAVNLGTFAIEKSYTGLLGLRLDAFATDGSGATVSTSGTEYREDYLIIGCDTLDLGQNLSQGSPVGSRRIKVQVDNASASIVTIHDTASTSAESGLPSVRLKFTDAGHDLFVRKAPGGVGVSVDEPHSTSTMGDVLITDTTASAQVFIGAGVTLANFSQLGGTNTIQAAATITSIIVNGGILITEGDYTVTTGNITGGTWRSNHIKTAGNAITTLNITGGLMDALLNSEARTWATVNFTKGSIRANAASLTITTLNEPQTLPYTVTAS